MPRRVPAPWTIADTGSSWAVADASGYTIVWVCYREGVLSADSLRDHLTREQARRIAANIAKLPEMLAR